MKPVYRTQALITLATVAAIPPSFTGVLSRSVAEPQPIRLPPRRSQVADAAELHAVARTG